MSEEGITCSIDLQFSSEAEGEDWFVLTTCGHIFHNSCILTWIGDKVIRACPVCNDVVTISGLRRINGINPTKSAKNINEGGGERAQAVPSLNDVNVPLSDAAMSKKQPDYAFNIVVFGQVAVGKTNLIQRFVDGTTSIQKTGPDSTRFKRIQIGGKLIELKIFDTFGLERFSSMNGLLARNAHGFLLLYGYDREDSLNNITYWIDFAKKNGINNAAMILVGNKKDTKRRGITSEQGHDFAKKNNLPLFETSWKDDQSVNAVFEALTVDVLNKVESNQIEYISHQGKGSEEGRTSCNVS